MIPRRCFFMVRTYKTSAVCVLPRLAYYCCEPSDPQSFSKLVRVPSSPTILFVDYILYLSILSKRCTTVVVDWTLFFVVKTIRLRGPVSQRIPAVVFTLYFDYLSGKPCVWSEAGHDARRLFSVVVLTSSLSLFMRAMCSGCYPRRARP